MEENLHAYRGYQFCRNLWFWFPVFFLYFTSIVGLREALLLEAVYYVSVVLLEVPSGYASDRFGRRVTLIASASFAAAAYALFVAAGDFAVLAAAQVLLAASMAFNSGSDASLLYDSLASMGRGSEYARQEGLAASWGFLATGAGALVAGLAAGFSLRLAYVLSLGGAIATLGFAFRLVEPPASRTSEGFVRQCIECARLARRPVLGWGLAFAVAMTVLNHVPYELYQGWLDLLLPETGGYAPIAPASGVLIAASMVLSAIASRRAAALDARWGPGPTLLATTALQTLVIAGMGLFLHPAIVALLLLRDVAPALSEPVLGRVVNERLESHRRATFLSIQSLAGRLAFAVALGIGSLAIPPGSAADWPRLSGLLQGFAIFGAAALAALWLVRPRELRS